MNILISMKEQNLNALIQMLDGNNKNKREKLFKKVLTNIFFWHIL